MFQTYCVLHAGELRVSQQHSSSCSQSRGRNTRQIPAQDSMKYKLGKDAQKPGCADREIRSDRRSKRTSPSIHKGNARGNLNLLPRLPGRLLPVPSLHLSHPRDNFPWSSYRHPELLAVCKDVFMYRIRGLISLLHNTVSARKQLVCEPRWPARKAHGETRARQATGGAWG